MCFICEVYIFVKVPVKINFIFALLLLRHPSMRQWLSGIPSIPSLPTCAINERDFPQGVGKMKKEAKTDVAKIAFNSILEVEEEEICGEK